MSQILHGTYLYQKIISLLSEIPFQWGVLYVYLQNLATLSMRSVTVIQIRVF